MLRNPGEVPSEITPEIVSDAPAGGVKIGSPEI